MNNLPPTCFGKYWSASETCCRGGNDPCYTNPKNGTNRRDACQWYSQCAVKTNVNKQDRFSPVPQQPLVPVPPPPSPTQASVQVMPRPFVPTPSTPIVPTGHQPMPVQATQQGQQVTYYSNNPYTQPQFANQPLMVPMNQPMYGAATVSFLMVPEPYNPNVPVAVQLTRAVFRSMGKAAALAFANYFDYYPWGPAQQK